MFFAVLAILVVISAEVFGKQNCPEVTIEQGILRGKYQETRKGRIFSAFTGIPYAQPPVDELRFEAPVPAEPWKGSLDASKSHTECPQRNYFDKDPPVIGNEDCLFLNVYTPQLPHSDSHLLPVVFFIHGGFFVSGSASPKWHGPEIFLDKDIVLVAPNYRLGALGFLTTGDKVVPGNNGLKDQNLALKWVKNNIAVFGGDPDRITLFGQSAGGVCSQHHMFSPLSKDLIKGVIAQSGTAFAPWAVARNNQGTRNSKKLAEFLNCPTSSSNSMVECLRKVESADIVKQEVKFLEWGLDPTRPFKPVIEPQAEGAFLSDFPEDVIRLGKAADVPLLTGVTTEEGGVKAASYYKNSKWIEDFDKEFSRVVPVSLEYENHVNKNNISKQLREFYFGCKKIDNCTKSELTNMYSDAIYLIGADEAVRMHTKFTDRPVYYYLFGYHGSESHSKISGDLSYDYGVCHADDLLYLFTLRKKFPNFEPTETDEQMMDVLTKLWANFATFGNPTPQGDTVIPTIWDSVQSDKMEYFSIKSPDDLQMAKGLYLDRVNFLRELNLYP